jgi:hypothetical protein
LPTAFFKTAFSHLKKGHQAGKKYTFFKKKLPDFGKKIEKYCFFKTQYILRLDFPSILPGSFSGSFAFSLFFEFILLAKSQSYFARKLPPLKLRARSFSGE